MSVLDEDRSLVELAQICLVTLHLYETSSKLLRDRYLQKNLRFVATQRRVYVQQFRLFVDVDTTAELEERLVQVQREISLHDMPISILATCRNWDRYACAKYAAVLSDNDLATEVQRVLRVQYATLMHTFDRISTLEEVWI